MKEKSLIDDHYHCSCRGCGLILREKHRNRWDIRKGVSIYYVCERGHLYEWTEFGKDLKMIYAG